MSTLQPLRPSARRHARVLLGICLVATIFVVIAALTLHFRATLGRPDLLSGYTLFAGVVFLALFNLRKRLSMVPALKASTWKSLHLFGGLLVVALYWLHTGTLWPSGNYEQALAALFYAVSASGVIGVLCQRFYPRRLTETGIEVIYERIPDEVVALREKAERSVLACTKETGSDTLAQFYIETFQWFFRRPRFLLSHLWGGHRAAFWVNQQLANARRYLGVNEESYLDELSDLAHAKARLDLHYALQGALKIWLLVHLPLAVAMCVLVGWHLLVANIYAV